MRDRRRFVSRMVLFETVVNATKMTDTLTPLILDFLEWIASSPRPYVEVMDAWRTSCPRLTIWEDAVDRGFVVVTDSGQELTVDLTPAGREFLQQRGP
jgi:hypothetical protein